MTMICKYCGQKMDPSDALCPHCHNPAAPLIGGNGFWDMTGTPSAAPAAPPQPREIPTPVPPVSIEPRKKSPFRGIIALALALSIISTTLTACNYFSTHAALKEQQQALDNQVGNISYQALEIQELKAFLSEQQDQIENSMHPRPQTVITKPEIIDTESAQPVGTKPAELAEQTNPTDETAGPTIPSSETSAATEPYAESSLPATENSTQTEVSND